MEDCIFCKIVKGELPSSKIYEDDSVLAFLDIAPVNIGHSLVIPKKHYVNIYDTPDDVLENLSKVVKRIAKAVKQGMKADGINISINNEKAAGQVVFHLHMHVIPRIEKDNFKLWHGERSYLGGEKEETVAKIKSVL